MTVRIDGTNSAANPAITGADADTGLQFGTNEVSLVTGGSDRVVVNSDGQVLINNDTSFSDAANGLLQLTGTEGNRNPKLCFLRNDTAVNATNHLGDIEFYSNDGSIATACAQINAEATQTHTADNRGTSIRFQVTQDGTNTAFDAMELDNDGRLRVFTPVANCFVMKSASTAGGSSGFNFVGGASALGTGGSTRFRVMCDGDCENTNNNYGAISDIKLKENIVDSGSQWDDLKALRVRKFNFKEGLGYGTDTHIGLVAQEVELVSPGLVKDTTDIEEYQESVVDFEGNPILDNEGNPLTRTKERETGTVTKKVSYSVLYMKAIKALQEAQTRIESMETQMTDLLARVTALEEGE